MGELVGRGFVVDREDYVIDTSNSNPKVPIFTVYDTREKSLRESVLFRRVTEFVDKLLVNNQPFVDGRWGEPYQPSNPENFSLTLAIYYAVKASHLNTRDVASSLNHKFDGKLHRDDVGWQHTTSISLFLKDIECLLRDLYGDFDDDVIETTREAIFVIVQEFLRFTRNDLWLEHESARQIDYICGIGVPEDMGFSGSDYRASQKGIAYLFDRVREFRANQDAFSQYTARFVKALEEHPTIFDSFTRTEVSKNDRVLRFAPRREAGTRQAQALPGSLRQKTWQSTSAQRP